MERSGTDYAVLGMLTLGAMSGYDLRKTIGESIAYFWTESFGQIYPTLKRLAREKLVTRRAEKQGGRRRHVYELTEAGRRTLAAWLSETAQTRPPRNELLFKLFFARQAGAQVAIDQVTRCRDEQRAALARFAQVEAGLLAQHARHPDLPYWLITLRYGQLEAEAHLRWADEVLEILAEMQDPAKQ